MSKDSVQQRALQRLIEILGSPDALAARLEASRGDVARWLAAEPEIPQEYFLRAVDLLLAQPVENYVRPVEGRLIKPDPGAGKKCNNGE
jgi:hypothetical protein